MSKDGGDNFTRAIAICGLLIALLSLYVTWRQDKRIKTTTYSVNALQNRPLLEITGLPILKNCKPTISQHIDTSLARLSLFSQAKFFLRIVIYNNIN